MRASRLEQVEKGVKLDVGSKSVSRSERKGVQNSGETWAGVRAGVSRYQHSEGLFDSEQDG